MIINFSSGATLAIMLVSSIFLSNSFSDNFLPIFFTDSSNFFKMARFIAFLSSEDLDLNIGAISSEFSVFDYQERFVRSFSDITARNHVPILAGGTGLYLDSVLKGYRMVKVPEDAALRNELQGEEVEELPYLIPQAVAGHHQ